MANLSYFSIPTRPQLGLNISSNLPPVFIPDFYVSPAGGTGSGSINDPWSLSYAFGGAGGTLTAGKTVAVRGGTYNGTFTASVDGTAANPITFRQYPNERATILGNVHITGDYLWLWGLEVGDSIALGHINHVDVDGLDDKIINCIVHDGAGTGITFNGTFTSGGEAYGNLIYNNGIDFNLGHGLYCHNADTSPVQLLRDNIVFNNWTHNIQEFVTSTPNPNANIHADGNVCFGAATISTPVNHGANLLIDGAPAIGIQFTNNMTYELADSLSNGLWAANATATDLLVSGNYLAGGNNKLVNLGGWTTVTMQNNTFYAAGGQVLLEPSTVSGWVWSGNTHYRNGAATAWTHGGTALTYAGWKTASGLGSADTNPTSVPTGTQIFVRPNSYERGRGHVVIYNWNGLSTVNVDLSNILSVGWSYEVVNAQDYYGPIVASGTYSGGTIGFVMSGINAVAPTGRSYTVPPVTGPTFQAFIVRLRSNVPPVFTPDFYVSTTGGTGTGAIGDPWSLTYAFGTGAGTASGDGKLVAGKQVAIRGGNYSGAYTCATSGNSSNPIIFRQYPSEHVSLDGRIHFTGDYNRIWGFEIYNSAPTSNSVDNILDDGLENKVINCVVHDSSNQGIAENNNGQGGEVYGCLVYNNGQEFNQDHGMYLHNAAGDPVKIVKDNIIFNNWSMGIQCYVQGFGNAGIHLEGNVSFGASTISLPTNTGANFLLSGVVDDDIQFINNMSYDAAGVNNTQFFNDSSNAGSGAAHTVVSGNYFVAAGNKCLYMVGSHNGAFVQNNTFYAVGGQVVVTPSSVGTWTWSNNTHYRLSSANGWTHNGTATTYAGWKTASSLGGSDSNPATAPTGTQVFVRPNTYEAGRGHVIIYNWNGSTSVNVDVSSVLTVGATYEVVNAQDYYGPILMNGIYSGGSLAFVMSGINAVVPIGRSYTTPPVTGSTFQTFIIRPPLTKLPNFYVSPTGLPTNTGTFFSPWSLSHVFSGAGGKIVAGKIIGARGGTYTGTFTSNVNGALGRQITVQAYPGEQPTIVGSVDLKGSYTWLQGFELVAPYPKVTGRTCLRIFGTGNKGINCIVHDGTDNNVAVWATDGSDKELYGCLLYNAYPVSPPTPGQSYGVYTNNNTTSGSHLIKDNIAFNNSGRGIAGFDPSAGQMTNLTFDGNILFGAGTTNTNPSMELDIAGAAATGLTVTNNYTYDILSSANWAFRAAVNASQDMIFTGNYCVGPLVAASWTTATVSDNIFYGLGAIFGSDVVDLQSSVAGWTWTNNTHYRSSSATAWRYAGASYNFANWKTNSGLGSSDTNPGTTPPDLVVVRPNIYETGRANIVVYNWSNAASVSVDLSTVLTAGQKYNIYNVQNFFGAPVASGTYSGANISLLMSGIAGPVPLWTPNTTPPVTGPTFQAFIVRLQGA